MNRAEILSKLKDIVENQLNEKLNLAEETALVGEGILDSLEFMNYLTTVEETFDTSISDNDIEKYQLGKISNMIDFLSK